MLKAVLIAVFAGLLWKAYFNFMRWFRQRSPEARERTLFKQRMPGWLKQIEMLLWVTFWLGLFFVLFYGLLGLNQLVHPAARKPSEIAGYIFLFSSLFAALAPAMLTANLVSWLVPAMRRANEQAMTGLPAASFQEANLGLIKVGGILVPLCLATAILGVLCF